MPPNAPEAPQGAEFTIERIGHLGDGIAMTPAGQIHVPFTAPGDRVARAGGAWNLVTEGPHRSVPPCRHFGVCGGCSLQNVAADVYHAAKREWVVAALARQGLKTDIAPLVAVPPASRRRASFAICLEDGNALVGFQERRTRNIVAVPGCQVLRPRIVAARGAIAAFVAARLQKAATASAAVTESETGLDVAILGPAAKAADSGEVAAAREAGIARLTWNGEVLLQLAVPRLTFSGVAVEIPPGAFVQAAAESEAALVASVDGALAGARHVADLYAGLGTFSFALARRAKVSAFEGDAAATVSLERAARGATGLKPITAERRDLARRPVLEKELASFEAVVLDPPRAGAEAQARHLARSKVARIAYVSCDPASFARDARILVEGGYALRRVTPVDQFLWSHHVELVGVFSRA
ncbi:MAG: RNA methyltransferase [Alphaproteobacteria bacterium]